MQQSGQPPDLADEKCNRRSTAGFDGHSGTGTQRPGDQPFAVEGLESVEV